MGNLNSTLAESASLLKARKCGCHLAGVALQSPKKNKIISVKGSRRNVKAQAKYFGGT